MAPSEQDARAVLELLRRAVISESVDDLSRLYAVDAVHEFPFTAPGLPSRLEGRDDIVHWTTALWHSDTLRYERYRTIAIHDTGDPDTIVVEQEVIGTSAVTGDVALTNIMVLTARDGQIVHVRDYANILAAVAAIGYDLRPLAE